MKTPEAQDNLNIVNSQHDRVLNRIRNGAINSRAGERSEAT